MSIINCEQTIKFLEISLNPPSEFFDSAQQYLIEDRKNDLNFFKELFEISNNNIFSEQIQLASAVVLKKQIENNITIFSIEIKNFLKDSIIDMIFKCQSNKTGKLMIESFYKILIYEYPLNWINIEQQVFQHLENQKLSFEKFYYILKIYEKIAKINEWKNIHEKKVFLKNVPNFLNLISFQVCVFVQNQTEKTQMILELVTKLLSRLFKINTYEYFYDPKISQFWFGDIFSLILKNFRNMPKAGKWTIQNIFNFFRRMSMLKQIDPLMNDSWAQNWIQIFFNTIIQMIEFFNPQIDSPKIYFLLMGCFTYTSQIPNLHEQYKTKLYQIATQHILKNVIFTHRQLEELLSNEFDLFKLLDDFSQGDDIRNASVSFIVQITEKPFLLTDIFQFLNKNLIKQNIDSSEMDKLNIYLIKEAYFHVLGKMCNKLDFLKIFETEMLELVQNVISKDIKCDFALVRMRSCSLLREIYRFQSFNRNFAQLSIEIAKDLCILLSDQHFYVKGAATLTLVQFLQDEKVANLIRPNAKELLRIVVSLIHEYENQMLIDSLYDICFVFEEEIKPFLIDLLKDLCFLICNLIDNKSSKCEIKEESKKCDYSSSVNAIFATISELVKRVFEKDNISKVFSFFKNVILKEFSENECENFGEVIFIASTLINNCENDSIPDEILLFHEFLSSLYLQKLPLNCGIQNPFFQLIKTSKIEIILEKDVIFSFFRSIFYKGLKQLKQTANEQYSFYLLLELPVRLINFDLKNQITNFHIFAFVFQANIIFQLQMNSLVFQPIIAQLIAQNLYFSWTIFVKNSKDVKIINWFLHNLGMCFFSSFDITQEVVSKIDFQRDFIGFWIKMHKKTLTFRTRKASFLGLTSILKNTNNLTFFVFSEHLLSDLISVLLFDLFVLGVMDEHEEKIREDDESFLSGESDDNSEEMESFFDYIPEKETIESFKRKFKLGVQQHSLEFDDISMYDSEICKDFFDDFDHIAEFKKVIMNHFKGDVFLLEQIMSKMKLDIQLLIKEELE